MLPTISQVKLLLSDFLIKNIIDLDIRNYPVKVNCLIPTFLIIGSGTSCRHIRKVGTLLTKELKGLGISELENINIRGSKIEDAIYIPILEIGVHLMTEQARIDTQMEERITHLITEENSILTSEHYFPKNFDRKKKFYNGK